MPALTQELKIQINAQDNASKTLQGVKQTAADMVGPKGIGGLANIGPTLTTAAKGVAIIGTAAAAAGGAAFAFTKSVVDANMSLITLSEKTGISADTLKQYTYVADATETSIDAIATGMKKLSVNMFAAATENKEQAKLFKALGVEIKDANGHLRNAEDVMLDVSDRFKDIQDETTKSALAVKLFGRSGTDIVPMLNQGRDGIRGLKDEAIALGLGLSEKAIKSTLDFDAAMDKTNAAITAAKDTIANEMAPVMTEFINDVVIPAIPHVRDALVTTWQVAKPAIELVGDVLTALKPVFSEIGSLLKMSAEGWKAILEFSGKGWKDIAAAVTGTSSEIQTASASVASGFTAATKSMESDSKTLKPRIEPGFKETKDAAHAQMEGIRTKFGVGPQSVLGMMEKDTKDHKSRVEVLWEELHKSTAKKMEDTFSEAYKNAQDILKKGGDLFKSTIWTLPTPRIEMPDFKKEIGDHIKKQIEDMGEITEASGGLLGDDLLKGVIDSLDKEHGFMDSLTEKLRTGKWKEAMGLVGKDWGDSISNELGPKLDAKMQDLFGTGKFGQLIGSAASGGMMVVASQAAGLIHNAINDFVRAIKASPPDLSQANPLGKNKSAYERSLGYSPPSSLPTPVGFVDGIPVYGYDPNGEPLDQYGNPIAGGEKPPDIYGNRGPAKKPAVGITVRPDMTVVDAAGNMLGWAGSEPRTYFDLSGKAVRYQRGGPITRPTMALMGEAGDEFVLNNRALNALERLNAGDTRGFIGAGGNNYYFSFNIQSLDPRGVREIIEGEVGDIIINRIRRDSEAGRELFYNTGVVNPAYV